MKTTNVQRKKISLILSLMGLVILFFAFDLHTYLTFAYIQSSLNDFQSFYTNNRAVTVAVYMGIYILVAALSLPGAVPMTLIGGALFGLWTAVIVISFASTIGATLAFLVSRFLFKDAIQQKFGSRLAVVNRGIRKEGAFYLFGLRLVPLFPFFVINLTMGLTPIRAVTFYLVSQIGMLPGTIVYVNAGTQLAGLDSVSGILSPGIVFSFVLLGIFPIIAKRVLNWGKARKVLAGYTRPKKFDYNMVVIGAGSAGLVSSYIAATVNARVALVEKHKMGGDCLNTGCVPSKALIRSAKVLSYVDRATEFGFQNGKIDYDFGEVMERVQTVIQKVAPHDSVERYTDLGVDCHQTEAEILTPWKVRAGDKTITTRNIIIAAGARPFVPPIPGLDTIDYLTSDTVWALRHRPGNLVVLGGGPIGCELSQVFSRLGSTVYQVEMGPRILSREDPEISEAVRSRFESEGIHVLTGHRATAVTVDGSSKRLICDRDGEEVVIPFDEILVAVGRVANTQGYGLEKLGITLTGRGTIETDEFLRTNFPNIFCAGDVTGPYQFTHTAAHQAWYASVNALFGGFRRFRVDYRVIPWSTFTDPEVARVGLNELEARENGIEYEVTTYGIDDLDRAIADSENQGVLKVLTRPGSDKILGVTIMGPHAGDIISEYVLAMKHGLGLNKILGTIHIYPTLAEANKYAAGEWKRAHKPERLLRWVKRYLTWKRG